MTASEYVRARKVLLDALQALGPQRDAVVLVGAQAVYLQVGEADLSVPAMTTDGDLVLDPGQLHDLPLVEQAMLAAGFERAHPGSWRGEAGIEIDLMVPEAVAGRPGRRGADLGVHGTKAARQARGLEAALVDSGRRMIAALDPGDTRVFEIAVAGTAALLVAKLHKIAERVGTKRSEDKDALDVLRLLRGTDERTLGARLVELTRDPRSAATATEALEHLSRLFVGSRAEGCLMAGRAAFPDDNPDVIAASTSVLASAVLRVIRG